MKVIFSKAVCEGLKTVGVSQAQLAIWRYVELKIELYVIPEFLAYLVGVALSNRDNKSDGAKAMISALQ